MNPENLYALCSVLMCDDHPTAPDMGLDVRATLVKIATQEALKYDKPHWLDFYLEYRTPTHIPGANPPIPPAERIAACVLACEGIPTEQLVAMNALAPGALRRAYDVCSEINETWGDTLLDNEDDIDGGDAVDTLCRVAQDVREVCNWAYVRDGK